MIIVKKKVIAYILLGISLLFFLGIEAINSTIEQKPASYYRIMALRQAMHAELQAAAVSGTYRALALPVPNTVEQVCVVDVNKIDISHFLCQMDRLCVQWRKKEANVFFLPSGDSFLVDDLIPSKQAECFQIVDGKLFFMLKQKDGKVFIEKN